MSNTFVTVFIYLCNKTSVQLLVYVSPGPLNNIIRYNF